MTNENAPAEALLTAESDPQEVRARLQTLGHDFADNEFEVVYRRFLDAGILGGVKEKDGLLLAVTEKRTKEEIDNLVKLSAL